MIGVLRSRISGIGRALSPHAKSRLSSWALRNLRTLFCLGSVFWPRPRTYPDFENRRSGIHVPLPPAIQRRSLRNVQAVLNVSRAGWGGGGHFVPGTRRKRTLSCLRARRALKLTEPLSAPHINPDRISSLSAPSPGKRGGYGRLHRDTTAAAGRAPPPRATPSSRPSVPPSTGACEASETGAATATAAGKRAGVWKPRVGEGRGGVARQGPKAGAGGRLEPDPRRRRGA